MSQENHTLAVINSKISNVGIYLLISLILLLVSRFFRGIDNEMYNKCFVLFYFDSTVCTTSLSFSSCFKAP